MKLILLRHAKAARGGPDFDRPLTERGEAQARALGDWLRAEGHVPDRILCSAARRTRQTAEGLAMDAPLEARPDLYAATATKIDALAQVADGETLLIVAHNPGIAEAAREAVAKPPDHPRFGAYPPCSCTVLDPATGRCLGFSVGGEA